MDHATGDTPAKPATAARIYDYFLGGIHNFPADQEVARQVMAHFPFAPLVARANRAFLRRAVAHLADTGIRQFLDLGSGIPTEGNVHEIAQRRDPGARVVYVDIDPVAVGESLEILNGNRYATAIRADLREPEAVFADPAVRRLLDFDEPVAVLLASVLHFVPDDPQAYALVERIVDAVPAGSYLLISHGAVETFTRDSETMRSASEGYRRRTSTPGMVRDRDQVNRFFKGLDLIEPGVVWVHEWHSEPADRAEFVDDPSRSGEWGGVGVKR